MFGNLFNPKKWTLGTIFDAAGTVGAAATGGYNPLKLGGDVAKGLSLASGLFGSGSSGNVPSTYTPGSEEELLGKLGQGELQFQLNNQPRRQQSILDAVGALDPQNDSVNAEYVRNNLLGQADKQGRYNANQLARRGYGSGVADAAILDARNNATEQGNEYFRGLRSPASLAQRYAGQADLLGGMGYGNSLSSRFNIQNQSNTQRMRDLQDYYNRPPSGAESFAGILGQVGPYLGKDKKKENYDKVFDTIFG